MTADSIVQDAASTARAHMRRKAVEFDEADGDGDQEIDYDEFVRFVMPKCANNGTEHAEEELKGWWRLMDVDGDGFIRKDEFFLYALCAASRRSGSGIEAQFRRYDKDGSGTLDEIEFEQALDEMGFGDAATAIFDEHANHTEHTISYLTLLKQMEDRTSLPAMRAFLLALASDSMLKVDTSSWSFTGESAAQVREALCTLLQRHKVRLSSIFQQLDDDGSFSLSYEEFKDAFWELGYGGSPEIVKEIFALLDQDGSGKAGFDEFSAWVYGRTIVAAPRPEERAARLSLVPQLQASFDQEEEAWTASRLQVELSRALAAEGLRAVDLLKAWDKNGDEGSKKGDHAISHKEFLVGLKALCGGGQLGEGGELWYSMARSAAVEAFQRMDRSGDKSISVSELCRWIDPHGRLVAAGRAKSNREILKKSSTRGSGELQPTGGATAGGEAAESQASEEEDGTACVYSPTKFSARLAQVRAYDPDVIKDRSKALRPESKRRTPLWQPRNPLLPVSPTMKPSVCGRDISHLKWRAPGTRLRATAALGGSLNATPRPATTAPAAPASAAHYGAGAAPNLCAAEGAAERCDNLAPPATAGARPDTMATASRSAAPAVPPRVQVPDEDARKISSSGRVHTAMAGPLADLAAAGLRLSISHATATPTRRFGLSFELTTLDGTPIEPSAKSCPAIGSQPRGSLPSSLRSTPRSARPVSAPLSARGQTSALHSFNAAFRSSRPPARSAATGLLVGTPTPSIMRDPLRDRLGVRSSPREAIAR